MAKTTTAAIPDDEDDPATTSSGSPGVGSPYPPTGMSTIDAPLLTKDGKQLDLEARSVKTTAHALNIVSGTAQNNRTRAARTADIQSLHDGAPPRSAGLNADQGKSWQSNASTGWLSGIVGKVAQRFVNAIISQIYVSSSSLPTSVPDWKTKTDLLRAKFTNLIRAWDGNTGLINSLCVEDVLQGYTYAVFLDPYTYKPVMFKQDKAFVPELSGQHARDLQFFVAKMDYRLDEFISLFRDESAAAEVGYDIENCVQAANQAMMADPRADATTTQFRNFVDMINEGTLGLSFTNSSARIVPVWLLFNREYDGKVSFWLLRRDEGSNSGTAMAGVKLRFSFKLFKSMEDVLAMFSFEPGNGCIHSSKGLGRKLANLAVMKELFRNGIIDNSRMSGLTILRVDAKDKTKFAPTVLSPFIMLDKSIEIPQQQIVANAEAYRIVDTAIDGWAEQAVGAYLTQQLNDSAKTDKTATEASIDARREMESADIQIRRVLDQFANLTQIQQLRAMSEDNISDARAIYKKILDDAEADKPEIYEGHADTDPLCLRFLVEAMQVGISDEELVLWRDSPASPYAHVSDKPIQQGLAAVKQGFGNSTSVDQNVLDGMIIEGMVGADAAKQIFIPQANTTLQIEASRKQVEESATMSVTSLPIAVSPRDNHIIEGETVQKILTAVAPGLADPQADPKVLKNAELNLNHLGEHLQAATQLGQNKDPRFKELEKFYEGFKGQLQQVVQIVAQSAAAQAQVTQQIRQEVGSGIVNLPSQMSAVPGVPLDSATGSPGELPASVIPPAPQARFAA